MQLSLDIIDSLRSLSLYTYAVLYEATIPVNLFFEYKDHYALPKYTITDDSLICHFADASIVFKNVRPNKIISLEVGPSVTFNEQTDEIILYHYANASDDSPKRTKTFSSQEERTEQNDILAELQSSIRGKIAGSYGTFSGELETQLQMKLGVNHSEKTVDTKATSETLEMVFPAWTDVKITQEHSVSDIKRSVKLIATLDADIEINGGWFKSFNSLKEMELYMKGGGGGNEHLKILDDFVNTRKFEKFCLPDKDYQFVIEEEKVSRSVVTSSVERTDTPIKH